ncbi:MAG: aspartate/glutamate racemase family protein [Acidobacteriota bacterium]|jgi:aspartate racemase
MKTLGLIGGMSWESTVPYYRRINELVGERLGGLHSAPIVMVSVDFQPIEELQHAGRWEETGDILAGAARTLEGAGAEVLVLCTNTMHKVAGAIEAAVQIPLLHIADATAAAVEEQNIDSVGLLGTRFTMEQDFYRDRLEAQGIDVIVPDAEGRELVHRVIYGELCRGKIVDASRDAYVEVIESLVRAGARGIVLGCTEIGLLVSAVDSPVPVFDTTEIHATAAVDLALAGA